jgi:zinc transport system substrate-binding protein
VELNGKKITLGLLILSLAAVVSGCGSRSSADHAPSGNGKLKVEVSFYPMYDFTTHVAGSLADVGILIPAGVEPHDWEPTPRDMGRLEDSNVLIYNGAGLEGWVDQVVSALDSDKLVQVEASRGISLLDGFHDAEDEETDEGSGWNRKDAGGLDPHVWLSPQQAIREVQNIEAGLIQAAPEHTAEFRANAEAYIAQLEQLDKEYRQGLEHVKRKDFVTQHAAFGYLAKDYGLEQIPIAGLSPEQEPSASSMADIIQFARAHHTKTIFFETLVSSKVADTVAHEIGAKTAVLNPIEGLTDEELASHMDYLAVMRQNLKALEQALDEE